MEYCIEMEQDVRKVTVNLPAQKLERAMEITGKGITATLVAALDQLERQAQRGALRKLRGKVSFDLDLGETRR